MRWSRSSTRCTSGPGRCRPRPRRGSRSWPTGSRTSWPTSSTTSQPGCGRSCATPATSSTSGPQGHLGGHRGLAASPGRRGRVANRDLLLGRADELSDAVAEQFNLESGSGVELQLDSVTRALAALELPSASTFAMPGGRLGSVLSSGRLAAYVPLMALSVALHTTLLDHPARGRHPGRGRGPQAVPDGGQAAEGLPAGTGQGRGGQVRRRGRLRDEQGHPGRAAPDPASAARRVPVAGRQHPGARPARPWPPPGGRPTSRPTPGRPGRPARPRRPRQLGRIRNACARSPRPGAPDGRRPHRRDPRRCRGTPGVGNRPGGGRIPDRGRRPAATARSGWPSPAR